jgi:hypothetical protein
MILLTYFELRWAACVGLALAIILGAPCRADVVITIDAETLNEVLPEVSRQEVIVPVSVDQSLTVRLSDLRITGFDPTAGDGQPGSLLASLNLEVSELGTRLPVQPRISLHVLTGQGPSELELRFEQLMLPLPLMKPINVAGMLPPLRFPADNLFVINGAQGDVMVQSQLERIRIEQNGIRFDFSVAVVPER